MKSLKDGAAMPEPITETYCLCWLLLTKAKSNLSQAVIVD